VNINLSNKKNYPSYGEASPQKTPVEEFINIIQMHAVSSEQCEGGENMLKIEHSCSNQVAGLCLPSAFFAEYFGHLSRNSIETRRNNLH